MATSYFGQPYQAGTEPIVDPPQPVWDFYEDGQLARNSASYPSRIYALVHFEGNYGPNCELFQGFERQNVNLEKAHELARAYFGECTHKLRYFNADGKVIKSE